MNLKTIQPPESEIRQLHAEICQALADPTRILLLYALAEGPQNVGELAETLQISQPNTSRHLRLLRERGMVSAMRNGPSVIYSLADQRVIQALDLMRQVLADHLSQRAEWAAEA